MRNSCQMCDYHEQGHAVGAYSWGVSLELQHQCSRVIILSKDMQYCRG